MKMCAASRPALNLALLLVLAGCRASYDPRESPAQRAKLLTIPDEYRSRSNPVAPAPAALEEGRARFEEHCVLCHGSDGRGQTPLGRGMYPRTDDLGSPGVQRYSDGQLYWLISDGVRFSGMPAYRQKLGEDQIWKLVLHVRQFRRAAP